MVKCMGRLVISYFVILLFSQYLFSFAAAETDSIEALRALYGQKMAESRQAEADEAIARALGEANFLRVLGGLCEVELKEELNDLCAQGAELLAANGELSHAPQQPEGMDDAAYARGAQAAGQSNLARFNWTDGDLLREAVLSFARDEGERNERVLGHRRWLLYPGMRYTGFGQACDAAGRTYALMYVMDDSAQADYDLIAWPSAGYFPAEYLTNETFWSISPNPERYDLQNSRVTITLEEQVSGARFEFDFSEGSEYCALAGGRYGDGPAYAFRPELSQYEAVANGYEQNQVWQVTVSGLLAQDGAPVECEYTVCMASLTPIDPAMVEFEEEELTLGAGQSCAVQARVLPAWADDTSLEWRVEDERIAQVDANGCLTGLAPGKTRLTARAVNGRETSIPVTVTRAK